MVLILGWNFVSVAKDMIILAGNEGCLADEHGTSLANYYWLIFLGYTSEAEWWNIYLR